MIHLHHNARALFGGEKTVADFFAISGKVAKDLHNRRVVRLERGGTGFYLKCHHPVGWREVLKSWSQLRSPDVGALAEWRAIERLHEIDVPTMTGAGYGIEGCSLAGQRSFLLTDELTNIVSLERIALGRCDIKLTDDLKRRLITQVAKLVARMHENGVNHRDLYLCHIVMQVAGEPKLYVIDLHRAQCRARTPRRWIIKDLAGLYFSAMDVGLTRRDVLRFVRTYSGGASLPFWQAVERRAVRQYQRYWKKSPPALRCGPPAL